MYRLNYIEILPQNSSAHSLRVQAQSKPAIHQALRQQQNDTIHTKIFGAREGPCLRLSAKNILHSTMDQENKDVEGVVSPLRNEQDGWEWVLVEAEDL